MCSWVHSSLLFPCSLGDTSLHHPLDGFHSILVTCSTAALDRPPQATSSPPSTDLKKFNFRLQRGWNAFISEERTGMPPLQCVSNFCPANQSNKWWLWTFCKPRAALGTSVRTEVVPKAVTLQVTKPLPWLPVITPIGSTVNYFWPVLSPLVFGPSPCANIPSLFTLLSLGFQRNNRVGIDITASIVVLEMGPKRTYHMNALLKIWKI